MANKTKKLALLVGGIALGLGSIAHAADAPKPAAAPAPAAARRPPPRHGCRGSGRCRTLPPAALVSGATAEALANTCAGCHGTGGVSSGPASPTLAGTNPEYFNDIMKRYADGRAYSTIMGRIAKGFTTEEIALMADYFAKASPSRRPSRSSTRPWSRKAGSSTRRSARSATPRAARSWRRRRRTRSRRTRRTRRPRRTRTRTRTRRAAMSATSSPVSGRRTSSTPLRTIANRREMPKKMKTRPSRRRPRTATRASTPSSPSTPASNKNPEETRHENRSSQIR